MTRPGLSHITSFGARSFLLRITCLILLASQSRSASALPEFRHGPPSDGSVKKQAIPQRSRGASPSRVSSAGFFLTFEEGYGHDDQAIGSFYSGLTFTNSGGQEWRFTDATTGTYNAHSVDLGLQWGTGQYNIYGVVATWTGIVGSWGRIDFNNRDGTYFQVRYCAASPLTLEAYDSRDSLLGTATGPANLRYANGALDMGTLRVDAPPGQRIAWVKIHDTGNFWEVDNMEGDFTGVRIIPPTPMIGTVGIVALGFSLLVLGALYLRRRGMSSVG